MAGIEVFEDEAFGISRLAASIAATQFVPGRLGALGVFDSEGVDSTTIKVEKDGEKLALVKAAPRGGAPQVVVGDKRNIVPFMAVHLPQRTVIQADQIKSVRAFGSTSEVEAMSAVVQKAQAKQRRQLDATIEYQKLGAVKGLLMDADGVTPLLNLFDAFGIAKPVFELSLDDQNADIRGELLDLKDMIEDALGGMFFDLIRIFAGRVFFKKFIGHKSVKVAYERYENGAKNRDDVRAGFEFGGFVFEQYRGQVGGVRFVDDNEAHPVIENAPDLYITRYAPSDYLDGDEMPAEGIPYYSQIEVLNMKKGVALESQSNPICLCTRPQAAPTIRIKQ